MLQTGFLGVLSLISSFVQAVTGFGFSIIMMAVMPMILDYQACLAVSAILSLVLNAVILWPVRRHVDWKQLWLPCLFCLMGTSFGLFLMRTNPSPIYKRMLGVFLILLAVWLYYFSDRVRIRPTLASAGIAGLISGVCGGLFSVNGPPMVLYFISVIEDKKRYMATLQCYFLINNVYVLTVRFLTHMIPSGVGTATAWAMGGLLIGSLLGNRLFRSIDGGKLKGIVYIFMAVAGAWIAING